MNLTKEQIQERPELVQAILVHQAALISRQEELLTKQDTIIENQSQKLKEKQQDTYRTGYQDGWNNAWERVIKFERDKKAKKIVSDFVDGIKGPPGEFMDS